MQRVSRSAELSTMQSGNGYGPLSRSDLEMIKAATGTEFNWPPSDGEGFPAAAFDLSLERTRQMQAGSVLGEITRTDLASMRDRGIIDSQFVAKATEYLDNGKTQTEEQRRNRVDLTQPTPYLTKPDSIYL